MFFVRDSNIGPDLACLSMMSLSEVLKMLWCLKDFTTASRTLGKRRAKRARAPMACHVSLVR